MRFYLGTHQPSWLACDLGVPLLISHRRLAGRRTVPRATGPWALDSGGFTELSLHGCWRTTASAYVAAVRRYATEIGNLDWAAPRDRMTEDRVLARTGLSLRTTNTSPSSPTYDYAPSIPNRRSSPYRKASIGVMTEGPCLSSFLTTGLTTPADRAWICSCRHAVEMTDFKSCCTQ